MKEKTFNLEFNGCWRESNKSSIPDKSGIYCVYECTYDEKTKKVRLCQLIYIGESENVRDRLSGHEKQKDWKKHVGAGNELCYSFAEVDSNDRVCVEAAFIYVFKPLENTEYKDNFPFGRTIIFSNGEKFLLSNHIGVS